MTVTFVVETEGVLVRGVQALVVGLRSLADSSDQLFRSFGQLTARLPETIRTVSAGLGIGEEENWMLSTIAPACTGAEKSNSPVCPAYAEMSAPKTL